MNDSAADCSEALDPRVQIELERLNTATDEINRLEVELDEARLAFRRLLAEGHLRIQQLTKKLGTSVHKARPYYEARFRANITSQDLQAATIAYDKANSAHAAAREMVYLAEQGLARLAEGNTGLTLDPAWQEMLNHATHRVNQAESDRAQATVTQRSRAAAHRAATALVQQLQNGLKRHIAKSRPYFEEKARINTALEAQKARIQTLEEQVAEAKQQYSSALRNLERISDEIHKHRSRRQSARNEIDRSTLTDTASDTNTTSSDKLEELCESSTDASVREWLRRAADAQRPRGPDTDTWTEIDLDYSSPEEVSFEKCSLRGRDTSEAWSPPSPGSSRASAAEPRRIIPRQPRPPRRQSLDALLHDTQEKVKEMFQGQCTCSSRASRARRAARASTRCCTTPRRRSRRCSKVSAHVHPAPAAPAAPPEPRRAAARHPGEGQGDVPRSVHMFIPRQPRPPRRQSLDALLHDTQEKVKEMFQGLSLFGERRGSASAPRTPRRAPSPRAASHASDERYSDTDSRASVEMLTDEQIASLMLDAQLEAVCERLAGVVRQPRSPHSPPHRSSVQ
ncbi:SH3 domain-binding protein 5-like isoform X1 [Helicoverpa zea]|uniref:SH3 domain-binding protein 5-like isoform X1 n=1 Tax=Helicoverpa zea TaxID=7113 RepID=UPI001F580CC8|nr:SH3 domain-binding protein 5-like isoform X1 [Helicoverpa zea]